MVAAAVAWSLALGGAALAQRVTAQLQGKVVRGSEGAQGGATVSATNLDTLAVTTVRADVAGNYVLASLAPGQYLITVT
ncbi:MAG TPA: carboxypeptidase-like regulatory domain-containing protein, partial [Kofleriaceae bacterium]|nr:carboxypeptidase-like regulatory domain-containing protein [Kofleriaceae bacterium]